MNICVRLAPAYPPEIGDPPMAAPLEIRTTEALPQQFRLVGVATSAKTTADWRQDLAEMVNQFMAKGGSEFCSDHLDEAAWKWPTERMTYLGGDLNDPETYRRLAG